MRDDALSIIACGSNAAIGLPAYLMRLSNELDLGIRVLLTRSAERFVSPQVVGWHADEVFSSDDAALNPTEFARRSIGIVVLPATANMLAAAALGLAGTPGQTALLAATRPALFFPQLNASMWRKGPVRRHVAALRAEGHTVVDPENQQIYELWRREFTEGPAMPAPQQAVEIIITWLEKLLADA
ncbi:MAG TPA: flavoprotein [Pseudonocardiaceae bacterium]|jgi:phosphopantothenoylcysteine synthetase/decarboxylase|nr:flavoprotein [Pseudonocardiaceae bacterium]